MSVVSKMSSEDVEKDFEWGLSVVGKMPSEKMSSEKVLM